MTKKEERIAAKKAKMKELQAWLKECNCSPEEPLFSSSRGGTLSTDAVQYLLTKYAAIAQNKCSSLKQKQVSPHVLRHTSAMRMLQAGIDRSMIALWLGHECVETTQIYLDANLSMKEKLLEKMLPLKVRSGRYRADDQLLVFLQSL